MPTDHPRPQPATSGILYVRASLRPFARSIRAAGGLDAFLRSSFPHDELLVPYFQGARPFWRPPRGPDAPTNAGALGTSVAALAGAVTSCHPTHRFVGVGPRVAAALAAHDPHGACFQPIADLAAAHDFSMLLLGCVDESPGFSTVHAVQHELGLSQRHLIRTLLRWDLAEGNRQRSIMAPESPGCSLSFGKFYPAYATDANLVEGTLAEQRFLFVPSARRAMAVEREILRRTPRFVDCGRWNCTTCRLRCYVLRELKA